MQMLEQQGHTDLAQWFTWLRSRRVKEVSDFVRDGGQLEAVAGSRFSADSNRRFAVPPKHSQNAERRVLNPFRPSLINPEILDWN